MIGIGCRNRQIKYIMFYCSVANEYQTDKTPAGTDLLDPGCHNRVRVMKSTITDWLWHGDDPVGKQMDLYVNAKWIYCVGKTLPNY